MASDKPLEGKCGYAVVDKVGLEIHDEEQDVTYKTGEDSRLKKVVLYNSDSDIEEVVEPEYTEVLTRLRNGSNTRAVILEPEDEDGEEERVEVVDDDPYVTNHDTVHKGYCERWPEKSKNSDRCPVHPDTDGPKDQCFNVTHGLRAKRSNYYHDYMNDNDKVLVEKFVDNWLDMSSYDRSDEAVVNELYRIAVDQIRLWNAQDEFDKGLVYDQMEEYDYEEGKIKSTQENPANLPYDRLDRTTFKKLRDLGILKDPDSKKADAVESLAEKFADLE